MAKDKKFLSLLEKYQERFEQKGFLVGDVFKFNDNFKSHEAYKDLQPNVKTLLIITLTQAFTSAFVKLMVVITL